MVSGPVYLDVEVHGMKVKTRIKAGESSGSNPLFGEEPDLTGG